MAITYIGAGSNGGAPVTSVAVTHGLTILEDDKLIALCHMNNDGVTVNSPPSGWTSDASGNTGSGFGASFAILSKDATASEASSYTFGVSESTRVSVIIIQIRGATTIETDVFPPTTGGEESGSSTTECPTITVADNSMAFGWHLEDTSTGQPVTSVDNSYTWPDDGTVIDQAQDFAYRAFTTGAATGETKIASAVSNHVGYSFSYKETPGAGGIIPQAMHHYMKNLG